VSLAAAFVVCRLGPTIRSAQRPAALGTARAVAEARHQIKRHRETYSSVEAISNDPSLSSLWPSWWALRAGPTPLGDGLGGQRPSLDAILCEIKALEAIARHGSSSTAEARMRSAAQRTKSKR
jgi:hypothetical protein